MDSVVRDILVDWVVDDKGSDDELREIEEIGWKVRPYGLDNGRGMRGSSLKAKVDNRTRSWRYR
jgi:hypothetical protein